MLAQARAAASVLRVYGADSGAVLDPADVTRRLGPVELPRTPALTPILLSMTLAARLWINLRTVALPLRNVFMKSGITSRSELSRLDLG